MSDGANPLTGTLLGAAPAPVAPPANTGWQPGASRTMPPETAAEWVKRIERDEAFAKEFHPQWERALKRYAEAKVNTAKLDINALLDYRHVESKKSQLYHRTPEVNLAPVDPADVAIPYDQILPQRQKFLNYELGPQGANLKRALHKTLVDTLAASGWMILKLGYEQVTLPVPPDALGRPSPIAAVPVWSRRFISAVSSKKLLVPHDFHDTDFDAAPYLTIKGTLPISRMKRNQWAIPDDFQGSAQKDESVYAHDVSAQDSTDPLGEYTETWYRASLFDEDVFNPELYRCVILVKGIDPPVWCVNSPYQTLDPQGAVTDDSMIGNPIHVGTLRDLIDSAYVPSDLVVGEQLSTEVNKFRTDLIRNRRARKPITLFDVGGLDQDVIAKIEKNEGPVGVPAGSLAAGKDNLIVVVSPGTEPRDNYTAQDYAEKDWEQALGNSANQTGQFSKSKRTATEVRTVQGNSSARADTEKDRIRDYVTAAIRKFDVIAQRTATQTDVTKVLGQAGGALWAQWRQLPGKYGYTILPDAGQHTDAQQQRSQTLDEYNLLRKDERVNVEELLKKVARVLGYDPATFIAKPQEKQAEPIKLALSFNGQDVLLPASGRLLLDLLVESGVKLSPDTITMLSATHADQGATIDPVTGQPTAPAPALVAHGGSADRTEQINKHSSEKTGGIQGVQAA